MGTHRRTVTLRDPRFRDLVAELAAPLRGVAKDELIGEDIRQYRRLNRWRNAALGVVTMLLIGAVAAAAIAVQQRQTAMAQRDQALRNESRALAGLAENMTSPTWATSASPPEDPPTAAIVTLAKHSDPCVECLCHATEDR